MGKLKERFWSWLCEAGLGKPACQGNPKARMVASTHQGESSCFHQARASRKDRDPGSREPTVEAWTVEVAYEDRAYCGGRYLKPTETTGPRDYRLRATDEGTTGDEGLYEDSGLAVGG